MKNIIFLLLLSIPFISFSQVKVGADGSIHATGDYPSAVQSELKGFSLSVADITERNAIPSNFREEGMIILVIDGNTFYTLVGGVTNADWVAIAGGAIPPIIDGDNTYQFQDSTNTPPVSFPVGIDSVYYMVGGNGNGIFTGHNYDIALYINGVFDSFIDPTINDWGFVLTGVAQNTWHQYNGTIWARRNAPSWSTAGNVGGGILGSTNNTNVSLIFNNANRIILQSSSTTSSGLRFTTVNGTSNGIMGLNSNGLARRTVVGSGLTYATGTLVDTLKASAGGGGTVTSFSSGNLSPLFTTSVATATTTPALTFSLSNAAANTVLGNATSGSTAPSYGQIVNGQITNATIVATTKLSATGTPSSSTYLRGDDTWATVSSGTTSYQTITATASQTAFTFSSVPASYNDYWMDRNGVVVNQEYYTTASNIITFTSGMVVGDKIGFHRVK